MLKNYLTTALRTLRRNRGYTFINVAGFAVGIAVCLLIVLYVHQETSYDAFHEKADRLYRLVSEDSTGARRAIMQGPMGPTMARDFPAVEETVRLYGRSRTLLTHGERRFYVEDGLYADASFFDVFTFPLVHGDARSALRQPGSVVLAQPAARRLFGNENPVGQRVTLGTDEERTVTGVAAPVPSTSHFTFDYLTPPPDSLHRSPINVWNRFSAFPTFVLLRQGQSPADVEAGLPAFARQYLGEGEAAGRTFGLQPIEDIHLSDVATTVGSERQGDPRALYVFSTIAALILLIACINYVNLATARSAERAKEVGVRRAVGAQRGQVARQFLGESVLLCGAALVLGVALARAALPGFDALIRQDVAFYQNGWLLAGFAGAVLFVGVLAGLYPAFALSAFQPTDVLRGRSRHSLAGGALRRGLVVFQFAVSVALIAGTAVVFQQMGYVQEKKLGLDEEQVVVISLEEDALQKRHAAVRDALRALPAVTEVTSANTPVVSRIATLYLQPEGTDERQPIRLMSVAPSFTGVMGIEIAAGRPFSETQDESHNILINEAAARKFGWAEPVGKTIPAGPTDLRVVGVVADFHFASLREEIAPLMLFPEDARARYVMARLAPGTNVPDALAALKATFEQFGSPYPFTYSFLDDDYGAFYRAERRTGRVLAVFAGLAVLIAGLGLFGLAAFAAQSRTKEIAVRKALGASAGSIVRLLSKDFLLLVSVGFVLAVPLAWYAMRQWLDGFAYRVELGPGVFALAGLLALFIAAATVSTQALRAARTNPAQALRDE